MSLSFFVIVVVVVAVIGVQILARPYPGFKVAF